MAETARDILLRTAMEYQKYLDGQALLKAIATQATPTKEGYLVPTELINQLKEKIAA